MIRSTCRGQPSGWLFISRTTGRDQRSRYDLVGACAHVNTLPLLPLSRLEPQWHGSGGGAGDRRARGRRGVGEEARPKPGRRARWTWVRGPRMGASDGNTERAARGACRLGLKGGQDRPRKLLRLLQQRLRGDDPQELPSLRWGLPQRLVGCGSRGQRQARAPPPDPPLPEVLGAAASAEGAMPK